MRLSRRITGIIQGGSDGWDVYYRANRLSDEGLDIQGKALVINKRNDQNQIEDVRLAEVVDL